MDFSWQHFENILARVNVASADDGRRWTARARIDAIEALLAPTPYRPFQAGALSAVYARDEFDPARPFQLLSSHADAVYSRYHFEPSPWAPDSDLLGTFDNSITNAVALDLMLRGVLPAQAVVAFTGDEERHSRGAREVMKNLERAGLRERLAIVLVLDITGEDPQGFPCTLENIFLGNVRPAVIPARVKRRGTLARRLTRLLGLDAPVFVDAAPDETDIYHACATTCLDFGIPARPHPEFAADSGGEWMHSDRGLLIARETISGYAAALARLANCL